MRVFNAVLTPKPFRTVGSAVLNCRPCHLHSLGIKKGYKWLSHLKQWAPAPSHFNSFSGYYFVNYWIIVCLIECNVVMFHENYLISFHYLSFKLTIKKNDISKNNRSVSIYSNYVFSTSIQTAYTLSSQLFQSKLIL